MAIVGSVAMCETIVRRNRRALREHAHLADSGVPVVGTVTELRKVSAGKYGAHRWAATITYELADRSYELTEQWWPGDGQPERVGDMVHLRVHPTEPSRAVVVGDGAPTPEPDRIWRVLEVALSLGFVVAFVVALP